MDERPWQRIRSPPRTAADRLVMLSLLLLIGVTVAASASGPGGWSAAQLAELRSLSALEPVPNDPTNRVADDPLAAPLGERLFFETRLSSDGKVACGTCHRPELGFQAAAAAMRTRILRSFETPDQPRR